MTRQEKIREGTAYLIAREGTSLEKTDRVLKYLHSQGVVIKVGEIREIIGGAANSETYVADKVGVSWERSAPVFGVFMRAGYVAVEPLIKEE